MKRPWRALGAWILLHIHSVSSLGTTRRVTDACFSPVPGTGNRSNVTIRLLERSWLSQRLVTAMAAMLLREHLRYTVEIINVTDDEWQNVQGNSAWSDMVQDLVFDVDMEFWESESEGGQAYQQAVADGIVSGHLSTGYTGKVGLYTPPNAQAALPVPDYWKVYNPSNVATQHGFQTMNSTLLREMNGDHFPQCRESWCLDGSMTGYWTPAWCLDNTTVCAEVLMGPSSWSTGYFEEVAANLGLHLVFSYNTASALLRQHWAAPGNEGQTRPHLFYSWMPNWGTTEVGSLRVAFPHSSSITCTGGSGSPYGGTNRCDYPEVQLTKLVAKRLKQDAPEAYWTLEAIKFSRDQVYAMLGMVSPLPSDEEVAQAACAFAQSAEYQGAIAEFVPQCAKTPPPDPPGPDDAVFVASTGECLLPFHYACWDNSEGSPDADMFGTLDNSHITVRIAKRDWLSHSITGHIMGFLLKERFGYSVAFDNVQDVPTREWSKLMESNRVDVEPECWHIHSENNEDVQRALEKNVILNPTALGLVGTQGLFMFGSTVEDIPITDYYRTYTGGFASQNGFRAPNATELYDVVGPPGAMTVCTDSADPHVSYCLRPPYEGFYYPPKCWDNPNQCIEVIMPDPKWNQGIWEQVVKNNNMTTALAYYGVYAWDDKVVQLYNSSDRRTAFYSFYPDTLPDRVRRDMRRIRLPDFLEGCEDPRLDDTGHRFCDLSDAPIKKLVRFDLEGRAPEAAHFLQSFRLFEEQLVEVLRLHEDGGGNMTTVEAACWYVKNHVDLWMPTAPDCLVRPEHHPSFGQEVWNWTSGECDVVTCADDAALQYVDGGIFCQPCYSVQQNLVPSPDRLSCMRCEAGHAPSEDMTHCAACPAGRYSPRSGEVRCTPCPRGRYNPLVGQSTCLVCPAGGICEGTGPGFEGAISFVAAPGWHVEGSHGDLQQMVSRMSQENEWDPDSAKGIDYIGPFRCPAETACLGNNTCMHGMTGPLCGVCIEGYDRRDQPENICLPCSSLWAIMGYGFVACVGLIVLISLMDRSNAATIGNLRGVKTVQLKILTNFFVRMSVLNDLLRLEEELQFFGGRTTGGGPVLFSMRFSKSMADPSVVFASPGCLTYRLGIRNSHPAYGLVAVTWLTLPILSVALAILIFASEWLKSSFKKCLVWIRCSSEWPKPVSFKKLLRSFESKLVILAFFLHPMLTKQFLTVLRCQYMDNELNLLYSEFRMMTNPDINCESPEHFKMLIVAGVGVLVHSFGIPCTFWLILRANRHDLEKPWIKRTFGFMYVGYERRCHYHECVAMLRKTTYVIVAAIPWLPKSSRAAILLALGILFLVHQESRKPYDKRQYMTLDFTERWCCITLILWLLCRLLQDTLGYLATSWWVRFFSVLPAYCCSCFVLFFALYQMLRDYIWPIHRSPYWWLPVRIANRMSYRLTFTCIAPEESHSEVGEDHGHACLSYPQAQVYAEGWHVSRRQLPKLRTRMPTAEKNLLKSFLNHALEVLLQRHELVAGTSPEVVFLPTLLVQLERLLSVCMLHSIKDRIDTIARYEASRNTVELIWSYLEDGVDFLKAVLHGEEYQPDWVRKNAEKGDLTLDEVKEHMDTWRRSVSVEEMHLSLMCLEPKLLSMDQAQSGPSFLLSWVERHRNLVSGLGDFRTLLSSEFMAFHTASRRPGELQKMTSQASLRAKGNSFSEDVSDSLVLQDSTSLSLPVMTIDLDEDTGNRLTNYTPRAAMEKPASILPIPPSTAEAPKHRAAAPSSESTTAIEKPLTMPRTLPDQPEATVSIDELLADAEENRKPVPATSSSSRRSVSLGCGPCGIYGPRGRPLSNGCCDGSDEDDIGRDGMVDEPEGPVVAREQSRWSEKIQQRFVL